MKTEKTTILVFAFLKIRYSFLKGFFGDLIEADKHFMPKE